MTVGLAECFIFYSYSKYVKITDGKVSFCQSEVRVTIRVAVLLVPKYIEELFVRKVYSAKAKGLIFVILSWIMDEISVVPY